MLNLKRFVTKNLSLTRGLSFSTATRTRNFFEVDPIFPDFHDPEKYTKVERIHAGEAFHREQNLKTAFSDAILEKVNKSLSQKRRKQKRQVKATVSDNKAPERERIFTQLAERILADPDLRFPYGFGFDDYIVKLKEKRFSSSGDTFIFTLNNIFSKLNYRSDFELIQVQREAIIKKTADDFKEKARGIILNHVINEIKNIRQNKGNKQTLEKVISDKEFLQSSLGELEINQDLYGKLRDKIDESRVNNAAERLAEESLDRKLALNKEMRQKEMDKEVEDFDFHRFKDPIYGEESGEEVDDVEPFPTWLRAPDADPKGYLLSEEEFKRYQVDREIKRRYFKARNEIIRDKYQQGQLTDERNEEEQAFFRTLNEDPEVARLQTELDIRDKNAPSFEEIYNEVDKLLANAPLTIKKSIDQSIATGNSDFNPLIANLAINPHELLWGNVNAVIASVIPEKFLNIAYNKRGEEIEEEEAETKVQVEEEEVQQATFDISELNPQLEKEIEVFKSVRREPFFMHNLLNEIRYFSDRMHDAYLTTVLDTPNVVRPGDFYKYDTSVLKKVVEYDEEGIQNEPILYDGKAYGKGSRKTCRALAIVKEGTGKIRINKKEFINYFAHTSHRNMIVQPLALTANAVELDVDLYIWGGGLTAQSYAGRMAVAKALINWNPDLKKILKEFGMTRLDRRRVERKKVSLYKARTKYPYKRR